jgi:hypothetical protein
MLSWRPSLRIDLDREPPLCGEARSPGGIPPGVVSGVGCYASL